MNSTTNKMTRSDINKKYYANNKTQISRRRFETAIKKGTIPTNVSLTKHNVTLEDLNNLRRLAGLFPISDLVSGRKARKGHVLQETLAESARQTEPQAVTDVSVDDAISFLENNVVNPKTMREYKTKIIFVGKNIYKNELSFSKILLQGQKFIDVIRTKYPNHSSFRAYLQPFVWILDRMPQLHSFPERIRQLLKKELKDIQIVVSAAQVNKPASSKDVVQFTELRRAIDSHYPAGSQQRLLIAMYDELTVRDNYANVPIVGSKADMKNPLSNYLLLKEDGAEFYLRNYKSVKRYGTIVHKLTPATFEILKHSLRLQPRTFMFVTRDGKPYDRLSKYIALMFKSAGMKEVSINTMRQSMVSSELEKIHTAEERKTLAEKLQHAPITSLLYLRKLKPISQSQSQDE